MSPSVAVPMTGRSPWAAVLAVPCHARCARARRALDRGSSASLRQLHGATEPFSCCGTGDALKFLGCHLCYANPPI